MRFAYYHDRVASARSSPAGWCAFVRIRARLCVCVSV
jgi:hypothetical protein